MCSPEPVEVGEGLLSPEELDYDSESAKRARKAKSQYLADASGIPQAIEDHVDTPSRLAALEAKARFLEQLACYREAAPAPVSSSPLRSRSPVHTVSSDSIPSRDELSRPHDIIPSRDELASRAVVYRAMVATVNNSLPVRQSLLAAVREGRTIDTWPPPPWMGSATTPP